MRFKVDENLPVDLAIALRSAGHDAMTVLDQGLGGYADTRVAEICQREQRALITLDLDFANAQTFPPATYSGIVVLRLQRQDKPYVMAILARLMPLLDSESIAGKLWIVDEQRVRIR